MYPLAIVIPAYKARFLDETLRSIAAQSSRDFVVYVGDDASSEDIRSVCARWHGAFELQYTRFPQNLGAKDLVAQWQRCIRLGREPWVWMFGDDDVMADSCVEQLLAMMQREGNRVDLLHFNVEQLDAASRVIRVEPEFPDVLSVREFAMRRLRFQLASFAPDYAFSRAAFDRLGGFVPFPRAWCSDDATWIQLGARSGIHTIKGAKVGWRNSGMNISSLHGLDAALKARAQLAFLLWLDRFLLEHPARNDEPSDTEVLEWAHSWYFEQAKLLRIRFLPGLAAETIESLSRVRGLSLPRVLLSVLRSDARQLLLRTRRAARGH